MMTLRIGSLTQTQRSGAILRSNGIEYTQRKLSQTGEGCVHAITVSDKDYPRAYELLHRAGLLRV